MRRAATSRGVAMLCSCSVRAPARARAPACATRAAPKKAPELRARSALRERHHPRAGLAEVAGEDAIVVVVEARVAFAQCVEQVGHVRLAARRAEIAPAIDRVHFGGVAPAVFPHDADRAGVRPFGGLERGERGGEPAMMRVDALARRAHAGAATDLV